jgi:rubredoxin
MAQSKVQYQRGLSVLEFFDGYGPPERCDAAVGASRWPNGFVCPRCTATAHSEFRRETRL